MLKCVAMVDSFSLLSVVPLSTLYPSTIGRQLFLSFFGHHVDASLYLQLWGVEAGISSSPQCHIEIIWG